MERHDAARSQAINLRQRIRPFTPEQTTQLETSNFDDLTRPAKTYPTGMGTLTFEELYQRTSRITGYMMREQLGMSNPDDIDDCVQAGYFKVWQLLQKQPDLFADKPKRYIVQAVVFRSKVQRFSHQRHYRKIVWDASAETNKRVGPTVRQIDTWIDLESALKTVGEYVAGLDNPIYLLALYTLITQVRTRDVSRLFGCGVSTLNKAKRRVRLTLAGELPDYGCLTDTAKALCLPDGRQLPVSKTDNGLITEWVMAG